MNTNYSGKNVLIIGASRGIGNAIAESYANQGAKIFTPARKEIDLQSQANVLDWLKIKAPENVDVLVYSAAVNFPKTLSETSQIDLMQVLNVNFLSAHVILTHFAECMARGGGGHILGISSAFARIACSGRSSYSASKASLESLIRSIALEYAASGVLANSVAPGFIATDLTFQNNTLEQIEILETKIPLARLGTPSEVATFVTFLTSPSNTYITGQTFNIDGGFSIN